MYKKYFGNKKFVYSFFLGAVFLVGSYLVQILASNYATKASSDSVTDIVLSNTPVWNVTAIFVWGAIIMVSICFFIGLRKLQYMPFAMKSTGIFILTRSVFVSLTHISPFPTHIIITSNFFQDAIFKGALTGSDLFFSGHTGLPFLLALMFWHNKPLRNMFLGFSLMFAVVVLLGHIHYSIDVLSAFFITYSIYHICLWLFPKDRQLFLDGDLAKL